MDILSKLPERLNELITERAMNASDLAKVLEVNPATTSRYLNGVSLPSFLHFTKLLDFFSCSADFLIGLTEYPPEKPIFYKIPPFSKRFRELMDLHKMSQYRLHQITGFSYDNFNKWLKGVNCPYIDNLIKLAQAFDCSVDYLIGHTL